MVAAVWPLPGQVPQPGPDDTPGPLLRRGVLVPAWQWEFTWDREGHRGYDDPPRPPVPPAPAAPSAVQNPGPCGPPRESSVCIPPEAQPRPRSTTGAALAPAK